jgi:ATP-binding cassette subfamily C protein LapB
MNASGSRALMMPGRKTNGITETSGLSPAESPRLPPLPTPHGRLELVDAVFAYGWDGSGKEPPPVIVNANLAVAPGETIAVAGGRGSGKTTLLCLLAGTLRPQRGAALVDGRNPTDFNPASVRNHVAYVPKHGVLLPGTVLDNITLFRPQLEEAALETARLIGLETTILRMPLGFDTRLGTSASDVLSRGLKQLIVVARALATRPRVLLFDEVNAGTDSRSDTLLRSVLNLLRGQCTMVLASRELSILNIADRVYDLADGRPTGRKPIAPRPATAIDAWMSAWAERVPTGTSRATASSHHRYGRDGPKPLLHHSPGHSRRLFSAMAYRSFERYW